MMRVLIVGAVLIAAVAPAHAQEPAAPPLSCPESAVEITIDRNPPLSFAPLAGRPSFRSPGTEFTFDKAANGVVRLYTLAMVNDYIGGRSTDARLVVYAETAVSANELREGRSKWWELVLVRAAVDYYDSAAGLLLFDSKAVAECAQAGKQCEYAESSAISDRGLIAMSFYRDLGGANANNWTEARLLLDFSTPQPRVTVAMDCDYNEGGGACTAIDSGMAPRSTLTCHWAEDAADFRCAEDGSYGHRDFYLLSERSVGPRPNEILSLEEAATLLANKRPGEAVTVYRLGPLTRIDTFDLGRGRRAMLLASSTEFFVAISSNGQPVEMLSVVPHGVLERSEGGRRAEIRTDGWTREDAASFRAHSIHRDGNLLVLQVVEGAPNTALDGSPLNSYWIGIGLDSTATIDAIRLNGRSTYANCGQMRIDTSTVPTGRISRPFRTAVRVQPAFMDVDPESTDEIKWAGDVVPECRRNGSITWKGGRFDGAVDHGECKVNEEPQRVTVAPDGSVRFEAASVKKP